MRRFIPDPSPAGMPADQAEWIMRQLRRVSEFSYGSEEATGDNEARIIALEQHPPRTDNPHQTSWANLLGKPSCVVNWRAEYVDGATYEACDLATDNGYAMVANKQTQDRPSYQPIGVVDWITDLLGGVVWDTEQDANTSTLIVGIRLIWAETRLGYRVRFWIPDDIVNHRVELWAVRDPLGNPDYQIVVPEFVVGIEDTEQWIEIPVGQKVLMAGAAVDLVMVVRQPVGGSSFTGDWLYARSNGDPGSGEIFHQSAGGGREMRVSDFDDVGANRRSQLELLGPGDEIEGGNLAWTVISTDYTNTGHVRYEVEPAARDTAGLYTFTFRYYGAAPIRYDVDNDFYLGNVEVRGLYSETGYVNIAEDDNAYGVDLQIQQAYVSPDWDFLSYSG